MNLPIFSTANIDLIEEIPDLGEGSFRSQDDDIWFVERDGETLSFTNLITDDARFQWDRPDLADLEETHWA